MTTTPTDRPHAETLRAVAECAEKAADYYDDKLAPEAQSLLLLARAVREHAASFAPAPGPAVQGLGRLGHAPTCRAIQPGVYGARCDCGYAAKSSEREKLISDRPAQAEAEGGATTDTRKSDAVAPTDTTSPAPPTSSEGLKECPWCRGAMQFRAALWPSDGCVDAIIHAAPTDCPMRHFTNDKTDGSVVAAWNRRASSDIASDFVGPLPDGRMVIRPAKEGLSARLREFVRRNDDMAEMVSNLRTPRTDNDYGRNAAIQEEAADELDRLTAEVRRLSAPAVPLSGEVGKLIEEWNAAKVGHADDFVPMATAGEKDET